MKKILLLVFVSILLVGSISLTSALDWNIPEEINVNENFNIEFIGNELYGIEINIPKGFELVSDESNGKLINNVYRSTYAKDLKIILRSNEEGIFNFVGFYTEGNGVYSFKQKTINVFGEVNLTCPVCNENEEWSECVNEQTIRNIYSCGEKTNYICISEVFVKDCNLEIEEELIDLNIEDVSFFNKIKNFFIGIWDKIIFWN